jgi:tyrosyl-tRNA synthetase
MKNFLEELEWRGMLHDKTEGIEVFFKDPNPDELGGQVVGYIGFDPTADSLHVGSLAQIMLLKHFAACGHIGIVLIGGFTAMIGDPSGKAKERDPSYGEVTLINAKAIGTQLKDLFSGPYQDSISLVNNMYWLSELDLLDFLRYDGKHLTVNYMQSKDSVKSRDGLSFTEFTYQLLQAHDYWHLFKTEGCILQMGGSDQWGNITSGIELIRRREGAAVHGLTTKLITKADGSKFGKTEEGTIWLDSEKTSPYKFYQYWFNLSDEDASKFIRVFTLHDQQAIKNIEDTHERFGREKRFLQHQLANYVTRFVHGEDSLLEAYATQEFLFSDSGMEFFETLTQEQLERCFQGMVRKVAPPQDGGWLYLDDMLVTAGICSSKSEVKRLVDQKGITLNKKKLVDNPRCASSSWAHIRSRYLLVQKGKKDFYLIDFEQ